MKSSTYVILGFLTAGAMTFKFLSNTPPPAKESAIELAAKPVPKAIRPAPLPPNPSPLSNKGQGPFNPKEQDQFNQLTVNFQTGNYGNALTLIRKWQIDPTSTEVFKAWLKKQLPVVLTSQAWTKIGQGDCNEALPLLEESHRLAKLTETIKGLAYCQYKAKSFAAAEESFIRYLEQVPQDRDMIYLFADNLESLARYEEALEVLDRLPPEAQTNDKDLAEKRQSMRAKIKESYNQDSAATEHFVITFRGSEHDFLLNATMESLESAAAELVDIWGLAFPSNTIEVLLYPETDFGDIVSNGPKWAQGLYDGRMRIQIKKNFDRTTGMDAYIKLLRHELVHALVAEKTDRRPLPYWFNEGLAMYLECRLGCPVPPVRGTLGGMFAPKKSFLGKFTELEDSSAKIIYKQSLFMIHTLIRLTKESDPRVIRSILTALNYQSDLSSDGILSPTGWTFDKLYSSSEKTWNEAMQ